MSQTEINVYKQKLLIEKIADSLQFDRLAKQFSMDPDPAYLLVATALAVQIGILDTYNYFIADKNSFVDDPSRLLALIGTAIAVVSLRWMRDRYATAMANLDISTRNNMNVSSAEKKFENIVSPKIRLIVSIVAILLLYINLFFNLGFEQAVELNGLARVIVINLLIFPLIQIPLIIEFGLMYFSIHFLLPRYIAKADLDLFFYDPRNMGGLSPIGDLFKKSYYLYTGCLLLFFLFVYWPTILVSFSDISPSIPEPGLIEAAFFSMFWLLGVLSIGYSMYRTHSVMSQKKEEAIEEIEEEIRGHLENPYDINTSHINNKEDREDLQHRLDEIRGTKEYPSTFAMWSQIGISVILPQALQLTVQVIP